MGDDDVDRPEPPSGKAVTAMLREARSLSGRADKLNHTAAAVDDPTTQQLVAEACTSMEQLVHHLMLLERQAQRGEKCTVQDPWGHHWTFSQTISDVAPEDWGGKTVNAW